MYVCKLCHNQIKNTHLLYTSNKRRYKMSIFIFDQWKSLIFKSSFLIDNVLKLMSSILILYNHSGHAHMFDYINLVISLPLCREKQDHNVYKYSSVSIPSSSPSSLHFRAFFSFLEFLQINVVLYIYIIALFLVYIDTTVILLMQSEDNDDHIGSLVVLNGNIAALTINPSLRF